MKFDQASDRLKRALEEQQTISTKKLARLLQDMNFSFNENQESRTVKYLKGEIQNLHRAIEKLKKKVKKYEDRAD